MQKAVIIYSTTDGQTKRICEFLIQKLKAKIDIDLFSSIFMKFLISVMFLTEIN